MNAEIFSDFDGKDILSDTSLFSGNSMFSGRTMDSNRMNFAKKARKSIP